MKHDVITPPGLAKPRGFSHGILAAPGRTLFIAGQIGWDAQARLVGSGFVPQFDQALSNVVAVVSAAGGQPEHVTRLTIYVVDKRAYNAELPNIGEAYRRHMGRHYPAMALVEVKDLLEPGALVEIEGTAVVP